jgi:hypothetical protein
LGFHDSGFHILACACPLRRGAIRYRFYSRARLTLPEVGRVVIFSALTYHSAGTRDEVDPLGLGGKFRK